MSTAWLKHLFVGVVTALVALPFVWMAYAAFVPSEQLFGGQVFGLHLSLDNFSALSKGNFDQSFWGRLLFSFGITSVATVLQIVLAFLAAYGLRLGAKVLPVFVVAMAVPVELLMIPLYGVLNKLHILNTPWALVLPFAASPFIVYLMHQGLKTIPEELFEAVRLDGGGHGVIVTRLLAPLLRNHMVAAAVIAFAAHWNLVLYPRLVATDDRYKTVQTWISDFLRSNNSDWGSLSAAALMATVPLVVLYMVFERRVVETYEDGLKG